MQTHMQVRPQEEGNQAAQQVSQPHAVQNSASSANGQASKQSNTGPVREHSGSQGEASQTQQSAAAQV